ncbi:MULTISPECIES: TrmH family RNA methyltransferase [Amniculibacterium]|jgi:tRNA (guanosine-2'-O-)-methyltransferase|uniref:TrmH family RNA methyltransferase n=1 Tax=Amniculibacterium TaxID=2715289 RepID=UPI000F5B3957|nr:MULTISPECIES: RNA methyltransferase [Amniculibacterium]
MTDFNEHFEYLKGFLTPERLEKIERKSYESSDFVLPIMEDVYQFRNAAAIVRSAEASAFHKIIALESKNVFDPNLAVTKGADTWVEVEKRPHQLESLQEIKNQGYKIVAVSPENNATSLPDFQIHEPVALVFGTEWHGVTDDFLEFCDETLAIPMYGFTQSYNVSVAAAICMYDLKQKLIKSGVEHRLSEEKRMQLKIRWAVNSIRSGHEIYQDFLKKK